MNLNMMQSCRVDEGALCIGRVEGGVLVEGAGEEEALPQNAVGHDLD